MSESQMLVIFYLTVEDVGVCGWTAVCLWTVVKGRATEQPGKKNILAPEPSLRSYSCSSGGQTESLNVRESSFRNP